jgi:hypothetical protein
MIGFIERGKLNIMIHEKFLTFKNEENSLWPGSNSKNHPGAISFTIQAQIFTKQKIALLTEL